MAYIGPEAGRPAVLRYFRSKRAKEAFAKRRGILPWGRPPYGFKWAGPKGRRTLVDYLPERAVMQEIVRVREGQHWTWQAVADHIGIRLAEIQGGTYVRATTPITPYVMRKMYFRECNLAGKPPMKFRAGRPSRSNPTVVRADAA